MDCGFRFGVPFKPQNRKRPPLALVQIGRTTSHLGAAGPLATAAGAAVGGSPSAGPERPEASGLDIGASGSAARGGRCAVTVNSSIFGRVCLRPLALGVVGKMTSARIVLTCCKAESRAAFGEQTNRWDGWSWSMRNCPPALTRRRSCGGAGGEAAAGAGDAVAPGPGEGFVTSRPVSVQKEVTKT